MLGLPLAFAIPGILAALAGLPILYRLLRLTPPRPRTVPLPPLRLILDLLPRQETPAHTPPWLLILRLAIAAAVILAMAGPVWNPLPAEGDGRGPLLVVLDDGFAAAPDWDARIAFVRQRLAGAERAGRLAALAPLSGGARAIEALSAGALQERMRVLKPVPVEPDRLVVLPALTAFTAAHPGTDIVWITDGLERGGGRAFAQALVTLAGTALVSVIEGATVPPALAGADNQSDSLNARVVRARPGPAGDGLVQAWDAKGLPVAEAPFAFGSASEATARFVLPVELRNDIARLSVAGVASAGATALLDGRAKRRRVAIVTGETSDVAQPLLSSAYYIGKALAPFATVSEPRGGTADPILSLLEDKPSVMVLADVGAIGRAAQDALTHFVAQGGVLLRFAGSRLAAESAGDALVPVVLRRGGRTFGGALSWEAPKPLAPFDKASPFAGLTPPAEVTVSRQVLAEPDDGLPGKTWAQLTDGTPLVTAVPRGQGWVVLFHVTADTTWSTLPLSGLFVDMLRRVIDKSAATLGAVAAGAAAAPVTTTAALLSPTRTLDGFGTLAPPPPEAKPVPASFEADATLEHPPGFYGPPEATIAVNALRAGETLEPLDLGGLALDRQMLRTTEPIDLRAGLLAAALALLLADGLATLWLGGGVRRRGALATSLALGLLLAGLAGPHGPGPARADEASASHRDRDAALATRIGYITTGDSSVDETSRLGLLTLSHALADRTSLAPGDPVGLDPARDELAFYPLLYWPIVAGQPQPAPTTVGRIAAYMKQGGTIVFDTRDALTSRADGPVSAEGLWLQTMLSGVDVPELEPVPSDHVVTKTFYLLAGFVGRYASGQTWIEALPPASRDDASRPVRAGDSVSPIVITSNDLAAGWAAGPDGEPLYPLVPGGARQRELALRGGINLVIYTLTGNYKADQVHVRDLLERLAH